jgi:hypothetical protein
MPAASAAASLQLIHPVQPRETGLAGEGIGGKYECGVLSCEHWCFSLPCPWLW